LHAGTSSLYPLAPPDILAPEGVNFNRKAPSQQIEHKKQGGAEWLLSVPGKVLFLHFKLQSQFRAENRHPQFFYD
jgi:hypothetical protein